MLSYKEYDNAQAVEIVLSGRLSTQEFDKIAEKLEAFIKRHGQIRVLEVAWTPAPSGTTSSSA
jgi:ribosomal protein S3